MKKKVFTSIAFAIAMSLTSCSQPEVKNHVNGMKLNNLTASEKKVLIDKGTERSFSGEYFDKHDKGTYLCKQCYAPLYRSNDKFDSRCGWPSFDDEISGRVRRQADSDGVRVEILCSTCGGHLGHVFEGEGFTPKNTRHCVNSISLDFVGSPAKARDTAYFASGCFWGTQYWLQKIKGVSETYVGYMGGEKTNPTYEDVCTGKTGYAETVEVVYDPTKTSYENLVMIFFETHDQSQLNRQGPDIGTQYRSAVFYTNESQRKIATGLSNVLVSKGFSVATEITPASQFWKAENYHQDYYERKHGQPYCHVYTKKF